MPRIKKQIPDEVQQAQTRLAGMKSIDPALDLGSGVSVAEMEAAIDEAIDLIEDYNLTLSSLDEKGNTVEAVIRALSDLNVRVWNGVKFKYGADSNEYEMVGGTRRSERRRPSGRPRSTE